MINNILARVGFGGAKVDTKIENRIYSPGEIIKGMIRITGGNIAQKVRQIDLLLCAKVKFKEDISLSLGEELVLVRLPVECGLEIKSNQQTALPFEMKLPLETPLTEWQAMNLFCEVYLRTELDLEGAVDAFDVDRLQVGPLPVQQRILLALFNLGFRYRKAEIELGRITGSNSYFHQKLEFRGSQRYFGLIHELEVIFIPKEFVLEVIFKHEGKEFNNGDYVNELDDKFIRFDVGYSDFEDEPWEEEIETLLNSKLSRVFAEADGLLKSQLEKHTPRNIVS